MFDAALFRMAAVEAIATDPQQRILLEETYAALYAASGLLGMPISNSCGMRL